MLDSIRIAFVNLLSAPAQRSLLPLAVMLIAALSLSACGKKPGHVDPPPGISEKEFPRLYPDPANDPQPEPEVTTPPSSSTAQP